MNKESIEKALERFALISPLLEEDLEAAERRKRRNEILSKGQISERTLRRYLQAYRQKGLNGLMPKERSDKGQTRAIPEDILKEAISLKQELPQRSVTRILQILEGEKLISPGDVARSTLTRYLANLGLTQKELKQKEPKAL
ncbi:helix-turn-helix domain-containing protein, partial [Thermoanaerobacteraceae bacterium SP2]